MKRFARALVVMLGLAVMGSVVTLIPQKSATATSGAPVTVMNTASNAVPVTGNVNATVSGTVGVNNFPATQNVNITNPSVPVSGNVGISGSVPVVNVTGRFGSLPLVTLDAVSSPTAPFQRALCLLAGVSPLPFDCQGVPSQFQVPDDVQGNPQRLVIEYVSGNCTALPSPEEGFTVSLLTVAGGQQVGHAFALVSNGSSTLTFGQRTKIYADPDSLVLLQGNLKGGLSFGCTAAISGYLISPTL